MRLYTVQGGVRIFAGVVAGEGPCVHLGQPTGELAPCPACPAGKGGEPVPLLACAVHGATTGRRGAPHRKSCHNCHEREPVHPGMTLQTLQDRLQRPPPPGGWPHGWARWPVTVAAHQAAAESFLADPPPYPGGWSGRGVVIPAGGVYWPGAYVAVRMLRHAGCALPVQVWYRGLAERDPRYEALLTAWGAECVDALAHPAAAMHRTLAGYDHAPGRRHPPFELKLFAVLHSPFLEVLMLDADCYPCADPTCLLDEPRYREAGAVYWPDLPHTETWTRWDFWGVPQAGPACGFETGQYLIHKRTAWEPLALAAWYDAHGDWCYGRNGDHGDKGPHRVAWARLGREPVFYATRATWRGCAFIHPGPDGVTPLFVHRCRGKFMLGGEKFTTTPQNGINQRCGLSGEAFSFGFLDELRRLLPPPPPELRP